MEIDPRRYFLSEEKSRRIFVEQIAPRELAHGAAGQDRPRAVFVAGQPGAGKTRTSDAVLRQVDQRGGAVLINGDIFKPYHPEYGRLMVEDEAHALGYTSLDARRWLEQAERYVIEPRVDVVVETTMGDAADFAEPAAMFRAAGYDVEAVILAVPQTWSRLGILQRFDQQRREQGTGRLTLTSTHDAAYRGIVHDPDRIDAERLVDVVTVYRRGQHLLYGNELDEHRQWRKPPATGARSQPNGCGRGRGRKRVPSWLPSMLYDATAATSFAASSPRCAPWPAAFCRRGPRSSISREPRFPGRCGCLVMAGAKDRSVARSRACPHLPHAGEATTTSAASAVDVRGPAKGGRIDEAQRPE